MICHLCGTPQRCIGCGLGTVDVDEAVSFVCFGKTAAHLCTECIMLANNTVAKAVAADKALHATLCNHAARIGPEGAA